ncbi:MAG: NitT/TauT family transport system permease protein [Alphaproteobacteria bacterium]|nr:NitT/TauT family transport system permease protein [Alphaproteobacteria bacterium]
MRRLINWRPSPSGAMILGALPFLLLLAAYLIASDIRQSGNPNDKLLPPLTAFVDAIDRMAVQRDLRSGGILLWADTAASLQRLTIGLGCATAIGLVFGIATGLLPYAGRTFSPFIAALSMVPPMALLPILFIIFGLGELSKIVLIIIGVAPFMMRDVAMRVGELPPEQIIKAQTLGGSTWQIILRIVAPQILPRLIDAVRLSLGPAWLFLIAAEAIAATEGLGYRIFLVRRYLAMDVILPYVVWITVLAFLSDYFLKMLQRRFFVWFQPERSGS